MLYQRSREIEARLADLLRLIQGGRYSTPKLAVALGISKPTVSRCLSALRDRGYSIRAVKGADGWAYELGADSQVSPNGGPT
jgi:biotin operon repressor